MAPKKGTGIGGEFVDAKLGDVRRERRLVATAERLSENPTLSFPKALDEAGLEALYRFVGNVAIRPEDILKPHVRASHARTQSNETTLVLHDSSTMSFGSEGYREDLTASSGGQQRFIAHCSLAVSGDGKRIPHGVLAVSHHVLAEKRGEPRSEDYRTRWNDHIEAVVEESPDATRLVHVMDREADAYEILCTLERLKQRYVVRSKYDRVEAETKQRMSDVLAATPLSAKRPVQLGRRGSVQNGAKQRRVHPPRHEREAELTIRASAFSIERPKRIVKLGLNLPKSISMHVVHVIEEAPPEGEVGVEWTLLTSEPIGTAEEILRVVDWYRARWTIEEFFKALKTGCAFETRQLESLHSLTNALAIFLPIAWRLLLLKTLARDDRNLPASTVMNPDELKVLRGLATRRYKFPPEPTARDVYLALAAVGGHIKYNGEPGWITLSRGLDDLLMAMRGYLIAKNSFEM